MQPPPGSSVTVSLVGDDLLVEVVHLTGGAPANVLVSVDGVPVFERSQYYAPPVGPHTYTEDTADEFTLTLRPHDGWTHPEPEWGEQPAWHAEPGPAVVVVSVWPTSGDGWYLAADPVTMGGEYSPYVKPSVPSGRECGSVIRRSVFLATPEIVTGDDVAEDFHAAGITHLEIQLYVSPGDTPSWDTYEEWLDAWEAIVAPNLPATAALGFRVVGQGDAFLRNTAELEWMASSPWAADTVTHVCTVARDSGLVDGVEMVDEVRSGPEEYEGAVEVFLPAWRAVEGYPDLAWPHQYPINWEVPELSEYSSRYGSAGGVVWAHLLPDKTASLWQFREVSDDMVLDVPTERPLSWLIGMNGYFYYKVVEGNDYSPGEDTLIGGPNRAETILAHCWAGVAHGAEMFRCYGYDFPHWRNERANTAPGSLLELQTGGRPGDDRWTGLRAAYRSVGARQDLLAGRHYLPVRSGPWLFGRRGRYVFGVNFLERELPSPRGPGLVVSPTDEEFESASVVPAGGVILWNEADVTKITIPTAGARGVNAYAIVYVDGDRAWHPGTTTDVAVDSVDFDELSNPAAEIESLAGDPTGSYSVDVPDDLPAGLYHVELRERSGAAGTELATDDLIGVGEMDWDGTSIRGVGTVWSVSDRTLTSAANITQSARVIDVTAAGCVGIDWGNVENEGALRDLGQTSILSVDDPVDVSGASVTAVQSGLATAAALSAVDDFVDTEVAAIKAKTDQLTFTVANRVDSTTQAGVSTLDAAGIRSAIGMSLANLDTQLAALDALLDSILEDTGTTLPAQVSALNNLSAAQVNAEVVDALATDTYAEPTGVPTATVSLAAKINRLYKALMRGVTVTENNKTFLDSAGAAEWKKALSDNGTTYTEATASAP